MAEYLHPGVYIEEIERGPRPIEGVPTSTAAFLGETERGPLRPTLVTSYNEYRRTFGDPFRDGAYMPHAAAGFFENGGTRLYVCRIAGAGSEPSRVVLDNLGVDATATAVGPGLWGRNVRVAIDASSTKDKTNKSIGFRLRIGYWRELTDDERSERDPFDPSEDMDDEDVRKNRELLARATLVEIYDDLTFEPTSPDYYNKRLTDPTTNRPVSALASIALASEGDREVPDAIQSKWLEGGEAGEAPTAADFVGERTEDRPEEQGLTQLALDPFRDIALVYAPGIDDPDVATKIISHCESSRFRFAVIDCPEDGSPDALEPRNTYTDTSYAAFYCPWIVASDPLSGARVNMPPGGHVLGVYARTDVERGVFKAPANEIVRGALDLVVDINDKRQDVLNPRGVNAIRRFPGRGIRVWGARTLSSNGLWKYVSVRRLFIFLERSIYEGTQWVVFEPNDDRLWARVKDTIRLFLRTQWRNGALFGRTEAEAFFITCDRTTMTQDDIMNGRLICEIGIAPVRPAEFVIFRIFQHTAESQR